MMSRGTMHPRYSRDCLFVARLKITKALLKHRLVRLKGFDLGAKVSIVRLEGSDLLPQAVDVLGQRLDAVAVGSRRRTTQGEASEHAGQSGENDGDHIEHAGEPMFGGWSRPVGHGRR